MLRPAIASILVAALTAAAATPLLAQSTPRALTAQHSFPLAGGSLVVVFDGLEPRETVLVRLAQPTLAPPSVVEVLQTLPSPQRSPRLPASPPGELLTAWVADELGRLSFLFVLDDLADAGREIDLALVGARRGGQSAELSRVHLMVQAPTVIVPGADELLRVDLLSGAQLLPSIPGSGGLAGLAFSPDGLQVYVLRQDGRLEVRSAQSWDAAPLVEHLLAGEPDTLGASLHGGAAFVLSRPAGEPFAPGATLHFLDEAHEPLVLESMAQPVSGRRVALTADGLTAFVAEDDLLVREVDLLSGQPQALLLAGLAGDTDIVDLLLLERTLYIATQAAGGRNGALTIYDLDAGAARTLSLRISPQRLVALDDGLLLVVPTQGQRFEIVEGGETLRLHAAAGACLDAAPGPQGVLLLLRMRSGGGISLYDPAADRETLLLRGLPPAERLISHPQGRAVLLGDPSGAVHVFDPLQRSLVTLGGAQALPDAGHALLP
ncbi:MAG: hypothetical protein ACT4PU_09490 [Planctomycetota bacterium]